MREKKVRKEDDHQALQWRKIISTNVSTSRGKILFIFSVAAVKVHPQLVRAWS